MRKSIMLFILAVVSISVLAAVAKADSSYTYEFSSNPPGPDVPLNTMVTVTARTDDPRAVRVVFTWYNPVDPLVNPEFAEVKTVESVGGFLVASSTYTLTMLGEWRVYASFVDVFDTRIGPVPMIVAVRVIFFNVIPEVPVIGTAGASIAMVLGLAYRMKRRPPE